MPLSHLVIIPCPNGTAPNGSYRVSLFLAPRLREAGSLADYPLWREWGTRVANLQFRLFDGNNMVPPANAPITVVSAPVDPAVWQAVFGSRPRHWEKVKVDPAALIDRTTPKLTTADAAGLADSVEALYTAIAAFGAKQPDAELVAEAMQAVGLATPLATMVPFLDTVGNEADPQPPSYDFHDIMRIAAAHPELMRRLGLVVDLEVDVSAAATPPTELQIRTNFPFLPTAGGPVLEFRSHEQIPLRMQVDTDNRPEVAVEAYRYERYVNFAGGKYVVAQGSTAEHAAAGSNLQRAVDRPDEGADELGLPALDEAGLRVMHIDVRTMFEAQMQRTHALEAQADKWLLGGIDPDTGMPVEPPQVFAEDATAGIRWDALDAEHEVFRSLHQRVAPGGYAFPRDGSLAIVPPADEGWWSLALMTDGVPSFVPEPSKDFYPPGDDDQNPDTPPVGPRVDRLRFRDETAWRLSADAMLWSGWSLSGRRPAAVLDGSGKVTEVSPNKPGGDDPAQVAVDYEVVPKTLERLRFGHDYQFRGRFVDLCGNSELLAAAEPDEASSPVVTFGRTMPVASPTVVRRSSRPDPGVGDHTTTIVIRSELDQADVDTPSADRMLFVRRVPQLRLERHGRPADDGIDVADYGFLSARDAATLADQLLVDPTSGESVAGAAVVDGVVTPGPLRQSAGYLADPAAERVAFHDLPQALTETPVLMAVGAWPNPESVVLELQAGTGPPEVVAAERRVVASLPKGNTYPCAVSSAVAANLLEHFKWYRNLDTDQQTAVGAAVLNGQAPLFSPRQPLTLVHAVRVPLLPPSFGTFQLSRNEAGQTSVLFSGPITLHRATTDRLVMSCFWTVPDLGPGASGLDIVAAGRGVVTDTIITEAPSDDQATRWSFENLLFDFGDTRRHTATLSAESFCRYSSYFTERRRVTVTLGVATVLDARGLDAASVVVTDVATGTRVALDGNLAVDPVAGTMTPLPGGELVDGTELDVLFIPLPVSRLSSESDSGATVELTVPSSAAPPPPVVQHLVPAFARTVTATANKVTVHHDGRVVRALMTPPWNESGEGELLGIAVAADGSLSRWGRDATIAGTGATTPPALADFGKAETTVAAVDGGFDVAAHPVAYDPDRHLLTADIQVGATFGYRPFVQLHVCRYQPESVPGQHVSVLVACDVLRLGAARTVVATRKPGHQVQVTMRGPDNANTVTVTVESADPDISDPDLRWVPSGTPVTLTRTGTKAAARFTGLVPLPIGVGDRRLIVEDAEPMQHEVGGVPAPGTEVAYREVIDIPEPW